jgi:membrane-bound lytic murein transglycosylase B
VTAENGRRAVRTAAALVGLATILTLVVGLVALATHSGGVTADPLAGLAPAASVLPVAPSTVPAPGPAAAATAELPRPDVAWVGRNAERTGIGAIALSAYASADLRLAVERPRCRLSWATLAGIGYVESRHGTIGGRRLGVDGRPGLLPIFGVPLTGAGPLARVPDSDDGRFDGDVRYDRAMGPMQFVPSTWRTWGSDGDGDGEVDPQDIDDAAYSAGHYLCAAGVPLDSAVAWTRGVLSYNPSVSYLRDVLAAANAYASRSIG